jgi:hypothetical protein
MSLGNGFNDNKSDTKGVTNRESDGLSVGSAWSSLAASPFNTYEVAIKEGGKQSDATKVFSGPGTGIATGVGSAEDTVGWVTSTGNKIAINGTAGSESIEIIHHSGAQIIIDVDGSIFLMPTGRKGFGLHSNKGDGVVSAQGRLVLVGKSDITIETEGSMSFNVGQNMFMNIGGDLNIDVSGSVSESIDGAKTTEVVKDVNITTGGILRETVAGDKRSQVVGAARYDVGTTFTTRTGHDIELMAQKSININSKEDSTYEVQAGKLTIMSADDITVATENAMYVTSKDDISIEAADSVAIRSGGHLVMSSKDAAYLDAATIVDVRTAMMSLSATGQLKTLSGSTRLNSTSTIDINSTGAIDMRGSTIDFNKAGASVSAVNAVETTTPRGTPVLTAPAAPEYPDANTIIDNMTSEREAPGFPLNANKMSAHDMSIYENEGDSPDSKAKARAGLNSSAGSLYSKGADGGSVPDSSSTGYDGSGNTSKSSSSPYGGSVESISNTSEKISRNVTVGSFPGLASLPTNQMGFSRKEILSNVVHLSYNIIDPLLEKFGSSIHLSHGIRLGSGGSRHYVGKAVDLRASSRDHSETAMIAKWIVENLPYDRCFLEANHQGTIHIHVEAAPPGTSGAKTVWTCADPKCASKVDGIQLSYAQQGLKNMGFA